MPESLSNEDRRTFAEMGFAVVAKPPFVPLDEVQNAFGRSEMQKGCCGDAENLKFYAAELVQYDFVLVVDGDIMMLRSFDELLDVDTKIRLLGTYDYELDTPGSAFPPINGGWLLFRPNLTDFHALRALIREGDFRPSSGWKGSGTGWAYGGAGPQGLLSFYFNQVVPGKPEFNTTTPQRGDGDVTGRKFTRQPESSRFLNLDRAVYDVMAMPTLVASLKSPDESFERVQSFHFAGNCLKPWACQETKSAICERATAQWFVLRKEVATMLGVEAPERCRPGGGYKSLPQVR